MSPSSPNLLRRETALVLASGLLFGCGFPRRAAELPPSDTPFLAVLSGEMPEPINDVARHAWIVGSLGDGPLVRWEFTGGAHRLGGEDPYSHFGGGDVAIHGIVRGSAAEIRRLGACLDREAASYDERHPQYWPIPGPNSNTFVAEALRRCGIHVELPSTCIGRDYLGVVGVARTEAGTGVQLESWLAGVRIGVAEGVEAHVVSLAVGVHVWPPGVTVPANPGRIGVDLDLHASDAQTAQNRRRSYDDDDEPRPKHGVPYGAEQRETLDLAPIEARPREYGLGIAWLSLHGATVRRPDDAGDLAQRFTVAISARAVKAKKHLGWAFGGDIELGAGIPLGFAYGFHLYPAGIGWTVGPTGFIGAFGGFGVSGVSARVPGAFELPVEVRAELDATKRARLGLRAAVTWIPGSAERSGHSTTLSWGDELSLSTFARFGRTRTRGHGRFASGGGRFFGLERREVMGTYWLGVFIGSEVDFGG